jgi:hypothetical protein
MTWHGIFSKIPSRSFEKARLLTHSHVNVIVYLPTPLLYFIMDFTKIDISTFFLLIMN